MTNNPSETSMLLVDFNLAEHLESEASAIEKQKLPNSGELHANPYP